MTSNCERGRHTLTKTKKTHTNPSECGNENAIFTCTRLTVGLLSHYTMHTVIVRWCVGPKTGQGHNHSKIKYISLEESKKFAFQQWS